MHALHVHDDGTGLALYAAGSFSEANGAPAARIARWNGTSWSALGQGLTSVATPVVRALETYDDGTGPVLVAGGQFFQAGTAPVRSIAAWNGASWSALGNGVNGTLNALRSFDTGTGAELFAAGNFGLGPVGPAICIARWNGQGWLPTGTLGVSASALHIHDEGTGHGPELVVGGSFSTSPAGDAFAARLRGCPPAEPGVDFCSSGSPAPGCAACPCSNDAAPGTVGGCVNSVGASARLHASGAAVIGNDTLRFQVTGVTPSTFGGLVSANNALPIMGVCPPGSGVSSTLLDGLRCIGGALLRHGNRSSDANGDIGVTTNGWGPPSGPPGGLLATGGFVAGQTRRFQCFYRDDVVLGCGSGQNTSNAVRVTFLL